MKTWRLLLLALLLIAPAPAEARIRPPNDIFAIGWDVKIVDAAEYVAVAGARVELRAHMFDALATGGVINVSGHVSGSLIASGLAVELEPSAVVRGNVGLFGARVETRGKITGNLRIVGGHVTLGGEIDGDVDVLGIRVDVLPDLIIRGRLTYFGPSAPDIEEGIVNRHLSIKRASLWTFDVLLHEIFRLAGAIWIFAGIGALATFLILAILLLALWPNLTNSTSDVIRKHPLLSLGLGLTLLIGAPVAATIALLFGVGAVIALVLFALYVLVVPLSFLIGVLHLGRTVLRHALALDGETIYPVAALVVGTITIPLVWVFGALFGMLFAQLGAPYFGWYVFFLTFLVMSIAPVAIGCGAVCLEAFRRRRVRDEPARS